jgi:molybdopterin-guanine dinucleotide biosynthesis protein A
MSTHEFDAVILAGAESARFGGADKAMLSVGGRSLLERALGAVRGADRVVIAGPPRPLEVEVTWIEESPRGSGPASALAAGLTRVTAGIVAVLACDHPFVTSRLIDRLVRKVAEFDGILVQTDGGRAQPLVAAYRTPVLRSRLETLDTRGASMRAVLDGLKVDYLVDDVAALDCDTPEDLRFCSRLASQNHPDR